jgi:asparagine synthase (glutamine-hydrolysing)
MIAGIVNLDGAPVDPLLLEALANAGRTDADATLWRDGEVGLLHAPLHAAARDSGQPATLDGDLWISADARIDARKDLIRALADSASASRGTIADLEGSGDAALILRAYSAWGERCVERLLGDFAFAIWDARRQRLFCARDQLGVKPFFYAARPGCLVFSSEIDCVLAHPGVSDELDELAIADFLMCGAIQDPDATAFAAIRRLAPAHALTLAGGQVRPVRYWDPLVPAELDLGRPDEYTGRFNELLDAAVADRLGANGTAVLMSGGLDSTTVAGAAKRVLSRTGLDHELRAYTAVYERLIDDDEPRFAKLAADRLAIPLELHVGDGYTPFAEWDDPGFLMPEPFGEPMAKFGLDQIASMSSHSRVMLTGFDGDALCQLWLPSHFRGLLRSGRLARGLRDAAWLVGARRSLPPMGMRTRLRAPRARRRTAAGFPPWLDPGLVRRHDLRERWVRVFAPRRPAQRGVRADAVELLTGPALPELFRFYDHAAARSGVVARHPLLDLRVVTYLLSLPPIPWCVDKTILRRAGRGALPDAVLQRPKAPMAADPVEVLLRRGAGDGDPWDSAATPHDLSTYVLAGALPATRAMAGTDLLWPRLYVVSLARWLQARRPTG